MGQIKNNCLTRIVFHVKNEFNDSKNFDIFKFIVSFRINYMLAPVHVPVRERGLPRPPKYLHKQSY